MGKHRIDGPGIVGFIAAATVILVMAVVLWTLLPKTAQASDDVELTIKKSAIVELGSKYLESIADRNVLIEELNKAQKEIHRLQSATNCS